MTLNDHYSNVNILYRMDKILFICYRVVTISLDEDRLKIFLLILLLIQTPPSCNPAL